VKTKPLEEEEGEEEEEAREDSLIRKA